MAQYNLRNPAVKRLMREAEELRDPTDEYYAQPLEDNLFEWHFTLRGPSNTDYEGGIYHGRITLPPDYPMKPPSIILLTPNGRFEINKKICLSISGHHPESWQPSWSIRTALLAIIGFMPTHGNGAIGSLDYTPEERKQLAKKSQNWKCSECGLIKNLFEKKDSDNVESATEISSGIETTNEFDTEESLNESALVNDIQSLNHEDGKESLSSTSNICNKQDLNVPEDDSEQIPVIRHRSATAAKEEISSEESVKSELPERRHGSSYWSLIVIWIIVFIIAILLMRRLLQ